MKRSRPQVYGKKSIADHSIPLLYGHCHSTKTPPPPKNHERSQNSVEKNTKIFHNILQVCGHKALVTSLTFDDIYILDMYKMSCKLAKKVKVTDVTELTFWGMISLMPCAHILVVCCGIFSCFFPQNSVIFRDSLVGVGFL